MGSWGPGLYSDDFAQDLKPLVGALARLPVADVEIARLVGDANPGVADDPADESHTVFWLALADQFVKRGIDCPTTRTCALDIISSGADIAMMRKLNMTERDLRKRQANLDALRSAIEAAAIAPKKPRNS